METYKVDVLGTQYCVQLSDIGDKGGECNFATKTITINENQDESMLKYVVAHELIHAFMFESGVGENSEWGHNEECIDWFAIQMDKIDKVIKNFFVQFCSEC